MKTGFTDGTYNAVNWKTGSTDGTKNAVNLKKRENQYRASPETYKTEKTTNNDARCRGVY